MKKLTKTQRAVAQRALIWSRSTFKANEPRAMSCRIIEKQFGRGRIANWLRSELLTITRITWSIERHECKEYCLNLTGVETVKKLLNLDENQLEKMEIQRISDKYRTELETKNFPYTDKHHRQQHGLQCVRKTIRGPVLEQHGLRYDYDMVCAAPTLLYQRALRAGMPELIHIPHYIQNRQQIRQQISDQYGIELAAVKKLITGLFQGAYISRWQHSHCYRILKGNYNHIERLRADPLIQSLRADIQLMWQYIIRDQRARNEFTASRVLGSHKTEIYLQLEELVMKSARRYLKKQRIDSFNLHDGFQCTECVDVIELQSYIKQHTGYSVRFEGVKIDGERTTTLS